MSTSNSKRLAVNTFYMYIRMFLLMIISIYTSRVLLQQLGVEDYGIYNLVGSVVALFTSIRSFMTSPTQRFLNFEMGKNNPERLNTIFNVSFLINLGICVIFVLLSELVGLWFFEYKVNVDPERLLAAKVVFQISILSAVVGILTISYEAVIVANERFNFYAIISIVEAALKLGVIFLLSYIHFDKLITYGVLILLSSLVIWLWYVVYCRINFPESKLRYRWDKTLFKDMAGMAGWVFFGNMGYSFMHQGLNMMLNVFGGAIVNTARGVAYQVHGAISHFLGSISRATVPYSTKLYAQKDYIKYFRLIFVTAKLQYVMYTCLALPCFIYADRLLQLWLGQIPEYSVDFLRAVLIYGVTRCYQSPFLSVFDTANKLKGFEITNLCFMSVSFLFAFLSLKFGFPFHYCFLVMAVFEILNFLAFNYVSMRTCKLPFGETMWRVFVPIYISLASCGVACFGVMKLFAGSGGVWWLVSSAVMALVVIGSSLLICFSGEERRIFFSIIKK